MTTLAYFDCPTGLAGDMCLGALVDAGVPLEYLANQLAQLGLADEYRLWSEPRYPNGLRAMKVHVELQQSVAMPPREQQEVGVDYAPTMAHPHNHGEGTRHLPEIEALIRAAQLPERVERWSLEVFQNLAKAEALAHGIALEEVHFHEVGATDAIVDIVGTCLGLDWLGVDEIYCSALPVGGGTIWAAHGRLPVPAPAVLKLWEMRQVPVYSNGIDRELVTPTGAAIATTLAKSFGGVPEMTVRKVGLGAGSRQLPIANVLRLWIGDRPSSRFQSQTQVSHSHPYPHDHAHPHPHDHTHPHSSTSSPLPPSTPSPQGQDSVTVLETQVDDLSPQVIGYLYDELFAVGALDVFTTAIAMKKSRPGLLITVICPGDAVADCETVLFRETTTLGIRRQVCDRTILNREIQAVDTPYGRVRVKVARQPDNGTVLNVQPEYEDCAQYARAAKVPLRQVHQQALWQWTMEAKTH